MSQDDLAFGHTSVAPTHSKRGLRLSSLGIVVAICLLALCLRLGAVWLVGPTPGLAGYTESTVTAKNLVDGKGYTFDFYSLRKDQPLQSFMPPLYVGFVYPFLRWSSNPPLATAVAQAILSALICGAVYVITLTLSRKRSTAILAALASALYPVFVLMVTVWHSLILHTAVLLWALAVTLLLPTRPRWGWAALAGILWGLIILGRPSLLAFMPVVLFWLWLNLPERSRWLPISAVLMTAALLIVLPWTVRNYRVQGRIVPVSTNSGATFWLGNNPFTTGTGHEVYTEKVARFLGQPYDSNQPPIISMQPYPLPPDLQREAATLSEVELDRRQFAAGLAFIREQPREWLALMAEKTRAFFWFRRNIGASYDAAWTPYYKLLYASLLVLFSAGLVISLKDRRRYSLLYLLFVFSAVTYIGYNVNTRFRWEIELLFLVFAALCITTVAERLAAALRRLRDLRAAT